MALPNVWHLRTVAETSSKPCLICYKPTTAVLITPDNKDFFYACRGHLSDPGFCSPIVDEADVAAKKKKEDLDREIEVIKKEYEEKMKRKREKGKKDRKEEGKDKEKANEKSEKVEAEEDKAAEKEKDDKIKAVTEKQASTPAAADSIPRIYALHRNFYQMRLDRIRNAELARRNRERLANPSTFPSVPGGDL